MNDALCSVDGCERLVEKAGLCAGHRKRKVRGQVVNTQLARRPSSPLEYLCESALAYADADDDVAYERAKDNLRKAAMSYAAKGETPVFSISDYLKEKIAAARARGSRHGRPPSASTQLIASVAKQARSVTEAALQLGISRTTIWRALQKVDSATDSGPQPSENIDL